MRVLLIPSKIKDSVVLAGLSQLLLPWKAVGRLRVTIFLISLSSSLLIALVIMVTTVAMVVR
jgi:hypothetical protein